MGHSPEMSESSDTSGSWWKTPLLHRVARLREREDQVFLILALVIGALTGLAVVAFILLTERMGMRLYPSAVLPGDVCCFRSWARSESVTCCFVIFPTREAAEYRRPRLLSSHAKAASRCALCLESSFAHRQLSRAESRLAAKGLPFKSVPALPQCWAASWDCVPKK